MIKADIKLRVRYAETDQMGYVYYGNYAAYCEVGRVEVMRALGTTYKELEECGVMMPVIEYNVKYIRPAFYDDELTITTSVAELPKARIRFDYDIFNAEGTLLNKAYTTLVFVNKETGRPCGAPDWFMERLESHFGK